MDDRRFDHLARALGRPASRRGVLGALAGALALLGAAVPGRAQGRPGAVTVCYEGRTLALPAPAAQALLARGATPGPCSPPGAIGCEAGRELCARGTVCCGVGDVCTGEDFCCPRAQYCRLSDRCCPGGSVCFRDVTCAT